MATIYEMIFTIQLLIGFGLIMIKCYNLFSAGNFYDLRMAFLTFIGFLFCFGIGMIITILNHVELLFIVLFTFESWLVWFMVLLLFIEIIFYITGKFSIKSNVQQYNSMQERF